MREFPSRKTGERRRQVAQALRRSGATLPKKFRTEPTEWQDPPAALELPATRVSPSSRGMEPPRRVGAAARLPISD